MVSYCQLYKSLPLNLFAFQLIQLLSCLAAVIVTDQCMPSHKATSVCLFMIACEVCEAVDLSTMWDWTNNTHTHTQTYIYIYIYIYTKMFVLPLALSTKDKVSAF